MTQAYRCYLLDEDDHIAAVEVIECRDDVMAVHPIIHVEQLLGRKTWMPIAVSAKPLAAAGTSFLREPGSSPGMTIQGCSAQSSRDARGLIPCACNPLFL